MNQTHLWCLNKPKHPAGASDILDAPFVVAGESGGDGGVRWRWQRWWVGRRNGSGGGVVDDSDVVMKMGVVAWCVGDDVGGGGRFLDWPEVVGDGRRLFQAHDRKSKASHQFHLEVYGNCPLWE
uniref:Uncharacterized protein n=1 Tax=Tanacetum cinerariifolium TaxID=118510 RepID=A0A699JES6_TANCI|nr:hypothetical protein [Tanacetum cinerariifolium]